MIHSKWALANYKPSDYQPLIFYPKFVVYIIYVYANLSET